MCVMSECKGVGGMVLPSTPCLGSPDGHQGLPQGQQRQMPRPQGQVGQDPSGPSQTPMPEAGLCCAGQTPPPQPSPVEQAGAQHLSVAC